MSTLTTWYWPAFSFFSLDSVFLNICQVTVLPLPLSPTIITEWLNVKQDKSIDGVEWGGGRNSPRVFGLIQLDDLSVGDLNLLQVSSLEFFFDSCPHLERGLPQVTHMHLQCSQQPTIE